MLPNLLRRLLNQKPRRRYLRRPKGFLPSLEGLEDRAVPAFLAPSTYATGTSAVSVAVGDYNGDGKGDMAVVNQAAAGTVGVLLSNGDGSFQPMVNYSAGAYPTDAKGGDFNNDGKLDLAVVNGVSNTISVLMGNGDGSFAAPTANAVGAGAHSVNVGDFNNDGNLDLATFANGFANVLMGNGDGSFQPRRDAAYLGNSTNTVVGDFNRDGLLDLATSNTVSVGTVTILRGHGDGSFDPAANFYAFSAPVYLASGDFNHDGYDDLACPNSYAATSMSVLMNNGDGTFAAPHTYGIPQTGYEIEVEDFNGDGNDDFAVRGASSYMVELGRGDGTFYPNVSYAVPAGRFQAGTHGDFNGDGSVDFAYPTGAGVTVVMNAADDRSALAWAVGFAVTLPASTTGGSALPMTVSAVDAAGNVVSGFRGTVYITSDDPAAPAGIAYTFTAADAGTHSFAGSLTLVTGGTQTVTVATPFLTTLTGQVTVSAPVSHFGVSAPAASVAGETFSVTVSALDNGGTVGVGYSSTIHFASSDALAGLPADYTFTPADAGVHSFSVTLRGAGSRLVSVTEIGGNVTGSALVTVSAGAASSFSLAGASGAIGVARPVTILARDSFGNAVTGYAGTVRVTSSDPLAVLPGDVPLVNGTATFNVTFFTVGTRTVTATDVVSPSLTGTLSSDATPPVAALFTVTGYPATTAGVSRTFTVTVRDTINQVATGFAGTVYFSSSDVQAGLPASYTFTAADAGVHAFTATLKTAGTQSITVRDLSGALTGTQVGIGVSAAAFSGYRLSVPNGADSKGHVLLTAGEAVSLTVRAVDAFGNAVTGYRGKAKFSSTDAKAALPTDYSFTAADGGAHTFSVALKTATPNGTVWSVSVVDASLASSLSTITNFEVMNAAAAKFVLNVPSNIMVGLPFSFRVTALDAYGNRVKNYFGTIHFGNTAGVAGLPEDYTFNSDDAGDHIFSVTLSTVGTQTLSVVDLANSQLAAMVLANVKASGGGGGGGGGGKKP